MTKQLNKKINTKLWDEYRGFIRTKKGGWRIGKDVLIYDYSLFYDIMKSKSLFQTLLLSITGRMPTRALADWIEQAYHCTSFPDPRLWCNQSSALAGTMKCSPIAAALAGVMTSDTKVYGARATSIISDFLKKTMLRKCEPGFTLDKYLKVDDSEKGEIKNRIPGFNRPIANGDLRCTVMVDIARKYGFVEGKYEKLALEIHTYMKERGFSGMNVGAYVAAFMLDQGFSTTEIYRIFALSVSVGAIACYTDAFDRPAETFMPLQCSDYEYQGPPQRKFLKRV